MLTYFKQCGVIGFPLLIITVANIVIAIWCAVKIAGAGGERDPRINNRLNSILFWGALSAVLGFLGQYTGIYKALGAIINATEISPRAIMMGLRESFTTTLWGMHLLVWSSAAWAVLNGWYRRKTEAAVQPRSAD